jgi:phosphoribosyl-ATP pyrophosphohydrolase
MEELINKVIEWGEPKGLTENRPMLKSWPQYEKVQEEAQEIARSLVNNDRDGLIDGLGDTMVTLILLAKQNGLDIQECLEYAYNEIKGRTGKIVNGKFVKDS